MCQTLGCLQVSVPTPLQSTAVVPAPPAVVIVRQAADKREDLSVAALTPAISPTFASYRGDPLPRISKIPYTESHHGAAWRVIIPIQIPENNPTLSSLRYISKYSSTLDAGNSTIQADVILSTEKLDLSVAMAGDDFASHKLYRHARGGYAPFFVNETTGVSLLTMSSVKCNGGGAQWSHFIDGHEIHPNIRLIDGGWHLYLVFNVAEYSTKDTERFLVAEAIASWTEDTVAKKVVEKIGIVGTQGDQATPQAREPRKPTDSKVQKAVGGEEQGHGDSKTKQLGNGEVPTHPDDGGGKTDTTGTEGTGEEDALEQRAEKEDGIEGNPDPEEEETNRKDEVHYPNTQDRQDDTPEPQFTEDEEKDLEDGEQGQLAEPREDGDERTAKDQQDADCEDADCKRCRGTGKEPKVTV